ncbi:MAG: N-acetyltransferase [Lachnospiraceae bacterium]|nr:N-acetyltransferase [Lachnospiraceae bacterium]
MSKIIIREEKKEDYKATELMTMRAFWNEHFPGCNEHYLVHVLRESEDYLPKLSRVAELDGKIVGTIFYTKAWIVNDNQKHEIVTFGPLCVEPTAQGLGVGGKLLHETFKLVKEAGYPGICIFGEPEYYPKHGFKTCDHFGITDEEGNNFDAFMGYEVVESGFKNITGKFMESKVFKKCDDEKAIAEYEKQFPKYVKLKIPSQWLHKQKIGKVIAVDEERYIIQYWEIQLPARLKKDFDGSKPQKGDIVTFDPNFNGDSLIRMVEIPGGMGRYV